MKLQRIALIIANQNYRDEEYDLPKRLFTAASYPVTTVAKTLKTATGKMGGTAKVNQTIDNIRAEEFSAFVFVGGPGALIYRGEPFIRDLILSALNQKKIVAAICIAPTILAKAGALRGKKATVWNGDTRQALFLEQYGAIYQNDDVVVDENIITANGPAASSKFAKEIVRALNKN